MAAYLIVDVEVTNPADFEEYRQGVPATLDRYGGQYIVRGGRTETLEGSWEPKRIVVLEFPDRAAAKAWWSSPEYAELKALRQSSARTELVLVDGI